MELKDFKPKVNRMVLKGLSNQLKCEFLSDCVFFFVSDFVVCFLIVTNLFQFSRIFLMMVLLSGSSFIPTRDLNIKISLINHFLTNLIR